jgi:hypothetical protein
MQTAAASAGNRVSTRLQSFRNDCHLTEVRWRPLD